MCGLIGYLTTDAKAVNSEKTRQMVIDQYEEQHARGQRGFGTLSIEDNKVVVRRATEPVKAFFDIRDAQGGMILFHHRLPTSTANKLDQTHPILVPGRDGHSFHIMHNGVIRNATELKKKHNEMGYNYITQHVESGYYAASQLEKFNDSEALAIEVARFIQGESEEIGTEGTVAFLAVETNPEGLPIAFHYGRNSGNPLEIQKTESGILIASEADGEIVPVEMLFSGKLEDGILGSITERKMPFFRPAVTPPVNSRQIGFGSHNHYHSRLPSSTTPVAPAKKEEDSRIPAFDISDESPEAEEFRESMEDIVDTYADMASQVLWEVMSLATTGCLNKSDITKAMREIAHILSAVKESQESEELRLIRESNSKTMDMVMESTDQQTFAFSEDDLPFKSSKRVSTASEDYENDLARHIDDWGEGHTLDECGEKDYHSLSEIKAYEELYETGSPEVVY